jgi:hypothetical protein
MTYKKKVKKYSLSLYLWFGNLGLWDALWLSVCNPVSTVAESSLHSFPLLKGTKKAVTRKTATIIGGAL